VNAQDRSFLTDFDWSRLGSLRLRASAVADGLYVGFHRSARRGAGVEFGGHRTYVRGDDLRWLDRHALMRHGRLLVREFETETDRVLRLLLDATASMGYAGPRSPVTKLEYATLLAAVAARVALATGDRVAVDWIGGKATRWLPAIGGRDSFDRVVGVLEAVQAAEDLATDISALERALLPVSRYARRGAIVVLFSDLIDLPDAALDRIATFSAGGRTLVVVQILDRAEEEFPFRGAVQLHSLEGDRRVETDGALARPGYLAAFRRRNQQMHDFFARRGVPLIQTSSSNDPISSVRLLISSLDRARW